MGPAHLAGRRRRSCPWREGPVATRTIEGGAEAAEALHRERYLAAELLYLAEVDPIPIVDVIIDNTDFERPVLRRPS